MESPRETDIAGSAGNEPRLTVHFWRDLGALLLLGLAVHLLLPQLTSIRDAAGVVRQLRLWAVAIAVLAQVLSYWGSGLLATALVALAGRSISTVRGALITLAAASVGLVAGGMIGNAAASYRWARGSGAGKEGALLVAWLPTVFNSATLMVLSTLGVLELLTLHDLSAWQFVAFLTMLVLLALVGLGAWLAARDRERATAWVLRVETLGRRLRHAKAHPSPSGWADQLVDALAALARGGWRKPVVGAAVNVGFDALTLFFLFVAAMHPVSPGVLLAGYGLPLLLGRLSFVIPGGVGVVEATMVALYSGLATPVAVAVLVVLAYRLLSFWIPTLLGFPVAIYLDSTVQAVRHRKSGAL